jgi:hypothetical protein
LGRKKGMQVPCKLELDGKKTIRWNIENSFNIIEIQLIIMSYRWNNNELLKNKWQQTVLIINDFCLIIYIIMEYDSIAST